VTLCDLCDLLYKNDFCFFSVLVRRERRKIICTEDHKGHKDNPFDPNGLRLEPNLDGSAQRTEVPLEYGALEFETIYESLPLRLPDSYLG
jgi:hypothetical protein